MQHAPAILIADAPALDFLNSVATPSDAAVEWLDDGEGLLGWLQQAQLVPGPVLERMRSQALPGELDRVADQARNLREWFRGFVEAHRGRALNRNDLGKLECLNRLLERDDCFSQIAAAPPSGGDGSALALQVIRRWSTPETLLLPIGETLARFVCQEDFTLVRACEGPACTLLFVDHTRSRTRRWCSMALCGNRAKQAAHRRRLKRRR
ncbi:MAG TPA: CGNR zinc finger domain-containing protein [Steroidobacteraceae bacterium]|nr:CGNR zinc finger domain-containing protein [Steroidobacteraceae bacterium]